MVTSASTIQSPIALGEQRVTLRGLDWRAYQQIYQALPQTRAVRFTYDRGALEITMPLEDHEFAVRLIELFIRILVVERGLKIKTLGSTTLDREDLDRGAEPDNAYYIQNQPLVAGKIIDLQTDPPPDLVVEVDITHTDIDKLSLYANLGIPEFWRYNGKIWRIYQLENEMYREVQASPTFPLVAKAKLYEFLAQAKLDEVDAELNLRQWLQSLAK
ncbi:Uma2 family endonuclease [Nodosilinea sp. PGN35]|uniref:Uma2 family endonuclease n=1 Tax=Nodosilinea sp. PGN35 TaxID=3020489 RepID=UPI0023B234EA|nr:Uma2 family endonuclease [Nodosilinea sp. TSF1-S3]MDF0365155.1 Uma2 family endonuclease [Nodosilinea sp. TSF1-S3]